MEGVVKNNKQGGFIRIIIAIVVILILMKYSGITVSQVVNWFTSFFSSVFK